MTEKEKAKELINKFNGDKQYAKLAVNEIITEGNNLCDILLDGYKDESFILYWETVLIEIDNI